MRFSGIKEIKQRVFGNEVKLDYGPNNKRQIYLFLNFLFFFSFQYYFCLVNFIKQLDIKTARNYMSKNSCPIFTVYSPHKIASSFSFWFESAMANSRSTKFKGRIYYMGLYCIFRSFPLSIRYNYFRSPFPLFLLFTLHLPLNFSPSCPPPPWPLIYFIIHTPGSLAYYRF